jgi:hypothetical protein
MAATARMTGPVESHRGLGLRDHLCSVHDDPADYQLRLAELAGRPEVVG